MICPVEIASDLSALQAARVGNHAGHVWRMGVGKLGNRQERRSLFSACNRFYKHGFEYVLFDSSLSGKTPVLRIGSTVRSGRDSGEVQRSWPFVTP